MAQKKNNVKVIRAKAYDSQYTIKAVFLEKFLIMIPKKFQHKKKLHYSDK